MILSRQGKARPGLILGLILGLGAALAAGLVLLPTAGDLVLAFINGAVGGRNHFNVYSTLSRASLIVGMALSVLLSFRAGLINIGGEGQLVLGGLSAALIGVYLPAPPLVVMLASVLGGALAGGLWAMFAGFLEKRLRIPLLVGSLLLNYPASFFASYLVSHPLRDVNSGIAQSHRILRAASLPRFPGTILDYGILLTAAIAIVLIVTERRSVFGYRLRMQGYSAGFARASGFPEGRMYYQILFGSGAIAGCVGFIAVFGISHRYVDGMLVIPLYAWTGLVAVLLARVNPLWVPLAGLMFAALQTGAAGLERSAGVPREMAEVVQGAIILLMATGGLRFMQTGGGEQP